MKDEKKHPIDAQSGSNKIIEGVSRRQVLRGMMTSGIVAASSGAMVSGSSFAFGAGAEPKRGGKLKVASSSGSTADTLDPARGSNSTDYARAYMFYNGLTQMDESLTPKMSLAESFDTKDAQTWVIKLRTDVVFHDGSSFTSADVVYSLNRHKDAKVGSKVMKLATQMDVIKAVGKHEVHIHLLSPNADLPAMLATSHFLIVRDGTTDFSSANGTGPFEVKEFRPGVRAIGSRNKSYWKVGQPYLDEIELFSIPDEAARVNALLSGDVHIINSVNPRSVSRINSNPISTVLESSSGAYTDLVLRDDFGPVRNPNFVKAMKHLFNREQMRNVAFRGFGTIANDHPIAPNHRYFNADLPQTQFDLDKAKYYLEKSGMKGKSLPIVASTAADNSVEVAQILQLSAQQAGLKLDIKRVPADGYWSNHWMKDPMGFSNINARPTADLVFSMFYQSDASWNESGWQNKQFDQLLLAARGETNETKRKQMYGDMQVLVNQHCGVCIPQFNSIIDAYNSKIGGYTPHPLGGFMGYMFADQVWLEA
ncbi:ABC transporter substrate-binding protein [Marinomonas mediterranea]|uniref:ABC transporter substrate-binding protein n=1 Tax=Marinomonas mediterranea TaxID=119864 RepID=UPI002349F7DD|nr:ABC transporter substrate-binding protein [Marinomonas mediterranea]WCN09645.1 ABC transporter substrate-binding protein [Marinomonas mediterranea]